MSQVGEIRRMHRVEGYSIREISKRLDVCRNTVRNVLRAEREEKSKYVRKNAYKPKLGAYEDKLREILQEEMNKPPRERRNAILLYEELQGYGYEGAVCQAAANFDPPTASKIDPPDGGFLYVCLRGERSAGSGARAARARARATGVNRVLTIPA